MDELENVFVIGCRPVEPAPLGVIVIVPVYGLFGVIVKLVEGLFTLPDDGPEREKVVAGTVILIFAFNEVETFPAKSLAQAYRVRIPSARNVYVV